MQERFLDIHVDEDQIYIVEGPIWTSAGMTASLDLALAMVEKDLRAETTRAVAHRLVTPQRRANGQSQHSEKLNLVPRSDRIQNALNYARQNLSRSLTVKALAKIGHLSLRQLSRVFTLETGAAPAKAIERLRREAARLSAVGYRFDPSETYASISSPMSDTLSEAVALPNSGVCLRRVVRTRSPVVTADTHPR
jgi:transcriptional regulator GlxA family with amidase domain